MPLKTAAAIYTGKEILKHVVDDLYKHVAKKTKNKYKLWETTNKIDTLYRKISKIRKVKTIWQVDKAIDLSVFYCDSHVIISRKRKKITTLDDLKTDSNILIEGIAGQGKSIFLRHLCAMELGVGQYIPIYLELRRVMKGISLKDRIYSCFETLGLRVDDTLFNALADSGKILLLLDAFDEIAETEKERILMEIEDLASTKDNLRILITTRPNNSIAMSPHFQVVQLDNLQGDEYKNVISKLTADIKLAKRLIDQVEHHHSHIENLLCTPLLVTLLIISYKAFQKLPTHLSDFYESLFQTLLQRHDGTKPGYRRERGCNMDDIQYRHVFEALCILAKESKESTFDHNKMYALSKRSLKLHEINENADQFLNDIVKITCLILRDGDEYRFIHKSVQEYYSSTYVQRKPEPWAKKFYSTIMAKGLDWQWSRELEFLSEVDTYRYNKYYLFPSILNLMNIKIDDLSKPYKKCTLKTTIRVLGDIELGFRIPSESVRFGSNFPKGAYDRMFVDSIFNLNYKPLIEAIRKGNLKTIKDTSPISRAKEGVPEEKVKVRQIIDANILKKEFVSITEKAFSKLFVEAQNLHKYLLDSEKDDIIKSLL